MAGTRVPAMALLVAVVLVLAACGSPVGGGDSGSSRRASAAGSWLCDSVPTLDRLVVHRSDAIPRNHMRFPFPAEVTVAAATRVRAATRALCSLPTMPKGAIHCPADFGIVYDFAFSAGARGFRTVEVDATGCQSVHGLGTVRWAARARSLWVELGRAMGLVSPTYAAFRGSGPNG